MNADKKQPMEENLNYVKLIAWGALVGLIIGVFIFFIKPAPKEARYTRLNPINYISELRLVRYHYEAFVPMTKKRNKNSLTGLYSLPLQMDGYIDFQEIEISFPTDSVVEIEIPETRISNPILDYRNLDVLYQKKGFWRKFQSDNSIDNSFNALSQAIEEVKKNAILAAENQGVFQRTQSSAEILLRNIYGAMGYQVRIKQPGRWVKRKKILTEFLDGLRADDLAKLSSKEKELLFLNLRNGWR